VAVQVAAAVAIMRVRRNRGETALLDKVTTAALLVELDLLMAAAVVVALLLLGATVDRLLLEQEALGARLV
jgi:hypothetical protein